MPGRSYNEAEEIRSVVDVINNQHVACLNFLREISFEYVCQKPTILNSEVADMQTGLVELAAKFRLSRLKAPFISEDLSQKIQQTYGTHVEVRSSCMPRPVQM